jgi:hypothetical protein
MATAAPLGGYRGGPAGRISEDHGDGADGTDTRARAKKYARRWGRFKRLVVLQNPLIGHKLCAAE